MKLSATLPATLALALFTSIPASAQDASTGPIGRLMERFRSSRADHDHGHAHAHAQNHSVPVTQPVQYVDATTGAPVAVAAAATVQAEPEAAAATGWGWEGGGGDPYGFIGVLNRIRASAGLGPVSYDSNLSSWARRNNAAQCVMGLGHHVNPSGVQNCAWNYSNADEAAAGWMNSPGHRENMLSPSITRVGIAFGPGPYWTLNAR